MPFGLVLGYLQRMYIRFQPHRLWWAIIYLLTLTIWPDPAVSDSVNPPRDAADADSASDFVPVEVRYALTTVDSLQLPYAPLQSDSLRVRLDQEILSAEEDFTLDPSSGWLRFMQARSGSLLVQYHIAMPSDTLTFQHFRPVEMDTTGRIIKPKPSTRPQQLDTWLGESALNIGGSKTVSVQVGSNRDMTLEQSLRVNITGQVTKDVSVIALLTDENTPIQPEGNTTELEELDKVLIQIKSPHLDGTLGDFDLVFRGTDLADYQRDLQGVRGDGRFDWGHFTVAGAVSRGEFHSNTFFGQEGNQGPYQLTDQQGSDNLVVLAGTEEVWINGEKLERGETADYTIEYASGRITFTPHRIITEQSRIVVDFQYSNQSYNRNFYASEVGVPLFNERLTLGFRFVQENDNRERPVEVALSEADKAALRQAGDDPTQAIRSGVEPASGDEGEYDLRTNPDTGEVYYVYVAADSSGDYTVRFSFVGEGEGSYQRSQVGLYYEYVGAGNGSYEPVVFLPLPRLQRMIEMDATLRAGSYASFRGELALTQLDENTFSGQDDGDNNGLGVTLRGQLRQFPVGLGQVDLQAKARYLDADFRPLGRLYEAEYDRRWNLDNSPNTAREAAYEVQSRYQPWELLGLSGFYGHTQRDDDIDATLWSAGVDLTPQHWPQLSTQIERNESQAVTGEVERRSEQVQVRHAFWYLAPTARFFQQKTERWQHIDAQDANWSRIASMVDDTYRTWHVGLATHQVTKWSGSAKLDRRIDRIYDVEADSWRDYAIGTTQTYRWSIPNWRAFALQGEVQHRTVTYPDGEAEDSSVQLVDLNGRYQPANRLWTAFWNYKVTNTAIQRQVEEYRFVGENQGDYSYDSVTRSYYPDPNGDFYRIVEDVGQPEKTIDLSSSLRLQYHAYRRQKKEQGLPWWQNFRNDLWIRVQEKTQESDQWAVYIFNWSKFQQDATTIQGRLLLEETLLLFPNDRRGSIELRYRYQDDETNQYVSRNEERQRSRYQVQLKSALWRPWTLVLEGAYDREQETVLQRNEDATIINRSVRLDAVRKPSWRWEYGAELLFEQLDVDDATRSETVQVDGYSLTPRLNFAPNRRSRFQIRLTWQHVRFSQDSVTLPFAVRGRYKEGNTLELDVKFNYQFFDNLILSLSYLGSKDPSERAVHRGQMQMQAYF